MVLISVGRLRAAVIGSLKAAEKHSPGFLVGNRGSQNGVLVSSGKSHSGLEKGVKTGARAQTFYQSDLLWIQKYLKKY